MVAANLASAESGAAVVTPCMLSASVEPSLNVRVTNEKKGPLPSV